MLLGGMSLRHVAAAAGVSPGTVQYHFPTMADLGRAMAEEALTDLSTVPIDDLAEAFKSIATDGVAVAVRAATQANWDAFDLPSEMDLERRVSWLLALAMGVGPDASWTRELLNERFWGSYRPQVAQILDGVLEGSGRHLVEPFTTAEIALITGAMMHGLLVELVCHPDQVRSDIYAEACVAIARSLTVPDDRRRSLDEIAAELHVASPPGSARDSGRSGHGSVTADGVDGTHTGSDPGVEVRPGGIISSDPLLLVAQASAKAFGDGIERIGFGDVLRAAETVVPAGLTVDVLAGDFGSVRMVAAASFSRHIEDLRGAARRRTGRDPDLALADAVNELCRRAGAQRWVALALLEERVEAAMRANEVPVFRDIRATVPLDGIFEPLIGSLEAAEPGRIGSERVAMTASAVIDLVLLNASTRPNLALGKAASMALRLVPGA